MPDRPIFLSRLALPVSWEPLAQAPSPEDCDRAVWRMPASSGFCCTASSLDAAQRPSDERLTEALAPLRIKLDIVIEMLGRLTYRDVALPPMRDIELGMTPHGVALAASRCGPASGCGSSSISTRNSSSRSCSTGSVASAVKDDATGGCGIQAELAEIPLRDRGGVRSARLSRPAPAIGAPAQL